MKKPKLTKEQKELEYSYRWCESYWDYEDFVEAHWYLVDKEGNTPIRTALDSSKGNQGLGAFAIHKEILKMLK